jgi:proline dehydrogenase
MALQAYLKRSLDDLEDLHGSNIKIRLVKGAYLGDLSDFHQISECYKLLVEVLAQTSGSVCMATHDPEILDWLRTSGIIETSNVEFTFLKGLADKTKLDLVKKGRHVSEYVPFGKESGPYIVRRSKYLEDLELLNKSPAP